MVSDIRENPDHRDIIRNEHVEVSATQNKPTDIDKCKVGFVSSVLLKLKTDGHYRKNCIISISLLWSILTFGWILGQKGPSFLDLQIITNTSIDKGSLFLTMHAFGYLIGSLITGIIYDKLTLDKSLLLLCASVGNAVILIVLPWCFIYELMIFIHILKRIFSSALETGGCAHLIYIWDGKCRTILQALHFSFSFGGILSPYAMSPFLAKKPEIGFSGTSHDVSTIGYINYTELEFNSSLNLESNLQANITDVLNSSVTNEYFQTADPYESRLYIAYAISAGFAFSAAVPFLVIFMKSRCQKEIRKKDKSGDGTSHHDHELPIINKVFFFIIISAFMAVYVAIEDSFNGYLATFCVKQMNWSKVDDAKVTSLYWASQAAGRFIGLFIIKRCRPSRVIVALSICFSMCQLGLFLSAFFEFSVGIWMSSAGVGLSGSIIFPTVFTWTHEEIMRVSGKIASLFTITAATGAVLNPIVLGPLMDKNSPMWFSYLLLGESVVQVLLFLAALLVVHKGCSSTEKENQRHKNSAFPDEQFREESLSVQSR